MSKNTQVYMHEELTRSEKKVLIMYARYDMTPRDIGLILEKSKRTVENQIASIKNKIYQDKEREKRTKKDFVRYGKEKGMFDERDWINSSSSNFKIEDLEE